MDLIAAMRGEYRRAEGLLWSCILLKVICYVTTLASVIWSNKIAAGMFLILGCLTQAVLVLLRASSRRCLEIAERLRRLAMLQDGIGRNVPPIEAALLSEGIWDTPEVRITHPYYTSQKPAGAARLVDITSECAFFSGSISNATARVFWFLSFAASAILVLVLVLIIELGVGQSNLEIAAKVVLLGITFWMTEDFVEMALRYRGVATACERVLRECRRLLDQSSPSSEDAFVLLHDYDCALTGAPPLPNRIYKRRSRRLEEIWRQTHPASY